MRTRRFAMLLSLLLTAAMLYALPCLPSALNARGRAGDSLRPTRARTLTVWLLSDDVSDGGALRELLAAFEREREGVRVFLRRVDADELLAPQAVLPDVALYGVGSVMEPKRCFMPLNGLPSGAHSAGMSGGLCYAAPLWYEPNVLCAPYGWVRREAAPSRRDDSFFEPATAAPDAGDTRVLTAKELPWRELLATGALRPPEGVAWQQLLATCPERLRAELREALGRDAPAQTAAPAARVLTLRECLSEPSDLFYPLAPAASDRVRFLSLCRDGEDARALAAYLLSSAEAVLRYGLMPAQPPAEVAEPLLAAACELCRAGALLPNAFAHAPQELRSLCRDAFMRMEDPAETLLKLR